MPVSSSDSNGTNAAAANQSAASPAQSASPAKVPRLIKFGGTLLDAQDRAITGPVGVTFALFSQQTSGAALWMETQNIKPDASGVYTILLRANSTNAVPAELFASGEARWLGIQVGQQPEQVLLGISGFTPTRPSMANLMRFKAPSYSDSHMVKAWMHSKNCAARSMSEDETSSSQ